MSNTTGSPIRFALIGAGHIGRRHARQMARCGNMTAVADPVTGRAEELAAAFDAHPYSSLETLLQAERPDVVAICTPNYLHAQQSIQALEAGCHVLCEKPMCLDSREAAAMIAAARKADRHLFIVKQNRFNPPVLLLHQLLQEGRLGKINSFQVNAIWHRPAAYYRDSDWHGKRDKDGGILFTQFSHFIDLLCWLLGDIAVIRSLQDNFGLQGIIVDEDTGVLLMRTDQGAIGTMHYTVGSYEKNMEGSITLLGEKGTVKIGGEYLNELDYFRVEGMGSPALPVSRPANEYGAYKGSMSNHDKVYDELLKALGKEPYDLVSALEGAQTVALIERIKQATLSNGSYPPR